MLHTENAEDVPMLNHFDPEHGHQESDGSEYDEESEEEDDNQHGVEDELQQMRDREEALLAEEAA